MTIRNKPPSKSIHRSVDRSRRAELQSTKLNFGVSTRIRASNEYQARQSSDQAK